MTARVTLRLVLVALASCLPLAAADWRAFRGNDGTATSAESGLPLTWSTTENVVWKTDLPGAGSSTPIVG